MVSLLLQSFLEYERLLVCDRRSDPTPWVELLPAYNDIDKGVVASDQKICVARRSRLLRTITNLQVHILRFP